MKYVKKIGKFCKNIRKHMEIQLEEKIKKGKANLTANDIEIFKDKNKLQQIQKIVQKKKLNIF